MNSSVSIIINVIIKIVLRLWCSIGCWPFFIFWSHCSESPLIYTLVLHNHRICVIKTLSIIWIYVNSNSVGFLGKHNVGLEKVFNQYKIVVFRCRLTFVLHSWDKFSDSGNIINVFKVHNSFLVDCCSHCTFRSNSVIKWLVFKCHFYFFGSECI